MGKARKAVTKHQGPPDFVTLMHQMEDRFCAAETPTVRVKQSNRLAEFLR
jgi:hypothetical protein